MNRSDAPKKQPVPFATNGQREDLLPSSPAGDNTASYYNGFPPVTMILKAAGGLPPKGQDMNQILFELSSLCRWMSSGALNSFDADFSAAIGGYPKASFLSGDDGETIYLSAVDGNTNNPNTNPSGWINFTKVKAIAALAGGANKLPYFTGVNTAAQTDLSALGRSVIGRVTAADVLTDLGIPAAQFLTGDTDYTGILPPGRGAVLLIHNDGSWGAFTGSGNTPIPLSLQSGGTGASNAADARQNLGVPYANRIKGDDSSTLLESGDGSKRIVVFNNGTWGVYQGNDSVPLPVTNGGTGSQNAAGARTNLGLGTAATRNVGTSQSDQIPDRGAWRTGGNRDAGWRISPDGFIEQWGRIKASDNGVYPLSLSFPNSFDSITITSDSRDTTSAEIVQAYPLTSTSFLVGAATVLNGNAQPASNLNAIWRAWGQ